MRGQKVDTLILKMLLRKTVRKFQKEKKQEMHGFEILLINNLEINDLTFQNYITSGDEMITAYFLEIQ